MTTIQVIFSDTFTAYCRRFSKTFSIAVLLVSLLTSTSFAVDFGAVADGDWSDAATWTPAGGPPGAGDDALIGSNSPAGSAAIATVTLTADQAVDSLTLGRGAGSDGTLDLANSVLTLNDGLLLGHFLGGTGNVQRTTGHFVTPDLTLDNGSTLNLGGNDVVSDLLTILGGSQGTTAAAGNLSTRVSIVGTGSQLTLGAPLTLSSSMTLRADGTVDLNNQDLVVRNLTLGFIGSGGNLINDAAITVDNDFSIEKTVFAFDADDTTTDLNVIDATVTLDPSTQIRDLALSQGSLFSTLNSSSVNRGVSVVGAGTQLTLATPMTLTGGMTIRADGTVDLNNQDLVVRNLTLGFIGSGGNLLNDAAITVDNDFSVEKTVFAFDADDTTTDLNVIDATVTLDPTTQIRDLALSQGSLFSTLNSSSVNRGVSVVGAGTQLTLAAPMTLTGGMTIRADGTVDLNNQDLMVRNLTLGFIGSGGNLLNDAAITVDNDFSVEKTVFAFDADDTTTDLNVIDATVTLDPSTQIRDLALSQGSLFSTLNSSSVNRGVSVVGAGTQLTLAAPMTLSSNMTIRADGTVDLNNQDLAVRNLTVGFIGSAGSLVNDGAITVDNIMTVEISQITLTGGDDVIGSNLNLTDGGVLTYAQGVGETAGLTIRGLISILDTSVLDLDFGADLVIGEDVILRWANPTSGGDRVADINAFILAGHITVDAPVPFQVFDNGDGFTHVGFTVAVPEPSSLLLGIFVGFGVLVRRKKSGGLQSHLREEEFCHRDHRGHREPLVFTTRCSL